MLKVNVQRIGGKFEREGEQQPLVPSSWVAGGTAMVGEGFHGERHRQPGVFRAQEYFLSSVFCGAGAMTVLPSAPRASDHCLTYQI